MTGEVEPLGKELQCQLDRATPDIRRFVVASGVLQRQREVMVGVEVFRQLVDEAGEHRDGLVEIAGVHEINAGIQPLIYFTGDPGHFHPPFTRLDFPQQDDRLL